MINFRDVSAEALQASLAEQFSGGERWPVDRSALTALIDMGLSDEAIAKYFSVQPAQVAALRARYHLGVAAATSAT